MRIGARAAQGGVELTIIFESGQQQIDPADLGCILAKMGAKIYDVNIGTDEFLAFIATSQAPGKLLADLQKKLSDYEVTLMQ